MVSNEPVRKLALSFPETEELPHFRLTSFRVRKKIFTTLDTAKKRVMVKLKLTDQSVFCAYDKEVIYPVPGGWGRKGATYIELQKIKKDMLHDAITTAYCAVAPKTLAEKFLKK
jgi:predicted DNA-binding protein (MmcQ/YjbR family)